MLLVLAAAAQEQKVTGLDKLHDGLPDKEFTGKSVDTSFVAGNGERVLRQEIVVPATLEEVWSAVSTSDGLRDWVAPTAEVELKTGGHWYTNYSPGSKIGDPGTIYNSVLSYVPMKMIAMKIGIAPPIFPKGPSDAGTLFAVLTLEDLGNRQVRVSEHMVGFGPGEDWDKVYRFFETGNAYTLGQLLKRFEVGPRRWVAK
ncbi:MAG TPA: SRPBCC domain-containing protein [Terriglobales bacterium]|nr:SRPBCC domain-containing protein [Terriglobales bacterium]